jgi:hypothetical protein
MTSCEPNFWSTIATFCRELAPVSGALLDSISETAAAIERAGFESQSTRKHLEASQVPMLPPENSMTLPEQEEGDMR